MKFGLSDKDLNEIREILKKHPEVIQAILFGSRALGTFKPASDVDLALKGRLTISLTAKIKAELEEETRMPYFFDLVHYETVASKALKDHIDSFGQSIYKLSFLRGKVDLRVDLRSSRKR